MCKAAPATGHSSALPWHSSAACSCSVVPNGDADGMTGAEHILCGCSCFGIETGRNHDHKKSATARPACHLVPRLRPYYFVRFDVIIVGAPPRFIERLRNTEVSARTQSGIRKTNGYGMHGRTSCHMLAFTFAETAFAFAVVAVVAVLALETLVPCIGECGRSQRPSRASVALVRVVRTHRAAAVGRRVRT